MATNPGLFSVPSIKADRTMNPEGETRGEEVVAGLLNLKSKVYSLAGQKVSAPALLMNNQPETSPNRAKPKGYRANNT